MFFQFKCKVLSGLFSIWGARYARSPETLTIPNPNPKPLTPKPEHPDPLNPNPPNYFLRPLGLRFQGL